MSSCFYTHLLVEAVHGHLALRNENDLLPSTLSDKRIPWPICLWISPPRITASLLPEHVNPSRRSIHLYFSSFPRPHNSGFNWFLTPCIPALTSKVVQSHRRPAREGPNSSKYSKEFLPAPVPYTQMRWSRQSKRRLLPPTPLLILHGRILLARQEIGYSRYRIRCYDTRDWPLHKRTYQKSSCTNRPRQRKRSIFCNFSSSLST